MLLMTANFSALSSFFKLIGMLILLIVLLFAASFVSKWYAGAMSGKKYAGNIKIIETYPIGQGKMIQIIQVGKKYIALVQTKDSVVFLTELTQEDLLIKEPVQMHRTEGFSRKPPTRIEVTAGNLQSALKEIMRADSEIPMPIPPPRQSV